METPSQQSKESNMSSEAQDASNSRQYGIDLSSSAPPVAIPTSHVGEFVIPGTGRRVWWTGRVAIGLRYQPERNHEPPAQSALWVQKLLLRKPGRTNGAAA
jgi:hypothetical protein